MKEFRPFKCRMLQIGNHRIRVGVRPPAEGQVPLLLFNGIGGNIEQIQPLIDALPDLGIIVFDIPGVGQSNIPSRPYCLKEMAQLANDLVVQLGYAQVDTLGASWGGFIAQEFARRHPRRCRRLILAATSMGMVMVPGKPRALLGLSIPRRFVNRSYARQLAGNIYGGIFRQQPELAREHFQTVRGQSSIGYYLQMLAVTGWTSVHWLHTLRQPTLIMVGTDDPIVRPINGLLQSKLLPNAELQRFDCGHLFLLSRVHESAASINEFLKRA